MVKQQPRGEATRNALMRAAEKLISERGIENVAIRDIVKASGQKNESALQYHFKNRKGLIRALHDARAEEIREKRAVMLQEIEETKQITLRNLCSVMVEPLFLLAQTKPQFRRYIKAFGHELALVEGSALKTVDKDIGGGESGKQTGAIMRTLLSHLDEPSYRRRMDSAIRFAAISMSHHAHQKRAFKGSHADLYLQSLLDELEGLLGAPESAQTKAASDQVSE